MPDKKISELSSIVTINGNDLLVIVNGNETKNVTVNELIAMINSSLVTSGSFVGPFDAAADPDHLPDTGSGAGGSIKAGDYWVIIGNNVIISGLLPEEKVTAGDVLFAAINGATNSTDFFIVQGNIDQATESKPGIAEIATQAETDAGTDDSKYVTPAKLRNLLDSSLPEIVKFANVIYVDPAGNDSSGDGSQFNPFLTLETARDNASIGTLIIVNPGDYTISANNSISVDGVSWYFMNGAKVTKSTIGSIFEYNNPQYPVNILGYGEFEGNTNAYDIFRCICSTVTDFQIKIKAKKFLSNTNSCISISGPTNSNGDIDIDIDSVISYATACISISDCRDIIVKSNYVESTGYSAIQIRYSTNVLINATKVISTAGHALDLSHINEYLVNSVTIDGFYSAIYTHTSFGVVNCSRMISANMTSEAAYIYSSDIVITGKVYGLSAFYGANVKATNIEFSDTCGIYIVHGDSKAVIDNITELPNSSNNLFVNIYNAELNVGCAKLTNSFIQVDTGGKLVIDNLLKSGSTDSRALIVNGEAIVNNVYCDSDIHSESIISIFNYGKLVINGRIEDKSINDLSTMIYKYSGELILNGATLLKSHNGTFIRSSTGIQDIKVYSGGVNCNGNTGELLEAKKWKYKFTVQSVSSTQITVNDGSYNSTFQSNETSKALIAQQMVTLINGDATLDIVASQDNAGTDEYFYLESGTAGNNCSYSNETNLNPIPLRYNSYGCTNIISGTLIIEDANIN